jgi:phosphorylcholine metabolism protein LicD
MKPGEISSIPHDTLPCWEWGVRQGGMMNMDVMKKNVLEFKEVCDLYNLRFVLMFGSLLGVMRQGSLLEHDSDFDVFCFAEDYMQWHLVKKALKKRCFYIPYEVPFNDDYIIRGGEKIDINWIMPFGRFYAYTDAIYYPREHFDTLDTVMLFDKQFKIPFKAHQLLTDLYGHWRVPGNCRGHINIYPK